MCISQSSSAHKAVIMEKTADLIAVQITTIDTLHNHCKPQKVFAEKAGCSQSAVLKHIKGKFSRMKSVVGKGA